MLIRSVFIATSQVVYLLPWRLVRARRGRNSSWIGM